MRISLRQVNNLLFAAIVLINLYIIAAPLWPQAVYWWDAHHTDRQAQLEQLIQKPVRKPAANATKPQTTSEPNSIISPTMLLNQPILEGPESDWFNILYRGIWRWPGSSTPDKGGNTVFLKATESDSHVVAGYFISPKFEDTGTYTQIRP